MSYRAAAGPAREASRDSGAYMAVHDVITLATDVQEIAKHLRDTPPALRGKRKGLRSRPAYCIEARTVRTDGADTELETGAIDCSGERRHKAVYAARSAIAVRGLFTHGANAVRAVEIAVTCPIEIPYVPVSTD